MKFSINHHHHRGPYKTHHDSTQTTCLPQAALGIWLAYIQGRGRQGWRNRNHNIVSSQSEYCSCPWLRFPTCCQRCAMRDTVHRNTSSWARCRIGLAALLVPRRAGEESGSSHSLVVGWGMEPGKPGDRLDWWGRRAAEQSPVVARGKAGFLLDGKRLRSAFRVTCLGRGHCHQLCSRGTSWGQRGRGFSCSPCSGSLQCPAGPAAWGKAAGSFSWKTRAF